MNNILYKSLPANRAPHGHKFRLNKWYKVDNIQICERGFHASENIIDAMRYVTAAWLAIVEVKGECQKHNDKHCWSEMKVVKWYKWTKKDSISLAVYASELVLPNFEIKFPNDKSLREAIEAAKRVLKNNTRENRKTAKSAAKHAVRSASRATWSDWTAEYAARAALWAVCAAAEAVDIVDIAAKTVDMVAWIAKAAAKKQILDKCHNFVLKRAGFN